METGGPGRVGMSYLDRYKGTDQGGRGRLLPALLRYHTRHICSFPHLSHSSCGQVSKSSLIPETCIFVGTSHLISTGKHHFPTRLHSPSSRTMISSDIPDHWAISNTDTLATYMVSRFQEALQTTAAIERKAVAHPHIPLETICEADRMVGILARAYRNKGMIFYLA